MRSVAGFAGLLFFGLAACVAMAGGRGVPPFHLAQIADAGASTRVIVGFDVSFAPEGSLTQSGVQAQRAAIERAATAFSARYAEAIRRAPGSFRSYLSVPYAAIEVTEDELKRLAADPAITSLTANEKYVTQLVDSTALVRAGEARQSVFSGAGQTIAIIDTGVDKTHPFLAGRVVAEACFSAGGWCPRGEAGSTAPGSGMPCPGAGCDHGTHVAGIAAGFGNLFSGVAPQANLIAVQIFSPDGPGPPAAYASDLIAALDHVNSLRDSFAIAAVNLSLGRFANEPDDCDAMAPAIQAVMANLRSNGIATIVASGNAYATDGVSSPACFSAAISVGAVSTKDWGDCMGVPEQGITAANRVACYSNSSPKLSLLAPGSPINSSVPGGAYQVMNGTSMAAAHVAGAWAVLKQKKPEATVAEILGLLQRTGIAITDHRSQRETRRIDIKAALDALDANRVKLSYTLEGAGTGRVSFTPGGTLAGCAASCITMFDIGAAVTLTAEPAADSVFSGWSGACSGSGPCTLTLSEPIAVTGVFAPGKLSLSLETSGNGGGSVSFLTAQGELHCEADCVNSFDRGTEVTAVPQPRNGSIFGGWSGACGGKLWCTITMNQAQALGAIFAAADGSELPLTIERKGTGEGHVLFLPVGTLARCGAECDALYRPGTDVFIFPYPANGSTFAGWSGACKGTTVPCSVRMSEAKKVGASFLEGALSLAYVPAGKGAGRVAFSPAGSFDECTSACTVIYSPGSTVTLMAAADDGSVFGGWSGACSGMGACTVTLSEAATVTAIFEPADTAERALSFEKRGSGSGTVTFLPAADKPNCVQNCSLVYRAGTMVTITATPAIGAVFGGWSGACSGTGACALTMSEARKIAATFDPRNDGKVALSYTRSGAGSGVVAFSPVGGNASCEDGCASYYTPGTRVKVSVARLGARSVFAGWTGACRGKGSCSIRMRTAASVGAIFNAVPVYALTYEKRGTGSGAVSFTPGGETPGSCTASCTKTYLDRSRVTIKAVASPGSVFAGWSGACKGKRGCSLTMSAARSVAANFTAKVSSAASPLP